MELLYQVTKMSNNEVHNVNVASQDILITPEKLKSELPMSESTHATLAASRRAIEAILDRQDHRIFVVVGPRRRGKASRIHLGQPST